MRRLAVIFVSGLFMLSLAGTTPAVEKKGKDKNKKTAVKVKADTSAAKKGSPKTKATGSKMSKPKSPRKYDSFVDANKNGIDDRKEKLIPKSKAPKKAATSKSSKKTDKKTDKKTEKKSDN